MTARTARLRRRPLRHGAPGVALALALAACSAQEERPAAPEPAPGPVALSQVLEEVRRRPEDRLAGEVYCTLSIAQNPTDFPYKAFFGGLFDVPEDTAGQTLCSALVEAVIADDLTQSDLRTFSRPRSEGSMAALGDLLRKLLDAQLRLSSLEARAPGGTAMAPTAAQAHSARR